MFNPNEASSQDYYKKRQNSQSNNPMLLKVSKKKGLSSASGGGAVALPPGTEPGAFTDSFQVAGSGAAAGTNPADSSPFADTTKSDAQFNGVSSSSNLAETLQSCYASILELERKNQLYNVALNLSIYVLSQQVKHHIAITNNMGGMASSAISHTQSLAAYVQKHMTIQKTLPIVYTNNLELLDAYYDFVLYSLRGGNTADSAASSGASTSSVNSPAVSSSGSNVGSITTISAGYQILQVYKILRRLWIYGIINFLENMKNLIAIASALPPELAEAVKNNNGVPMENELCINFISHCFSLLSTLVEMNNNLSIEVDCESVSTTAYTNDPKISSAILLIADFQNWWFEKIADLSRMSIALYPSNFIDWEASAEHWYIKATSRNYGHGKTYYHLATVQQPSSANSNDYNSGYNEQAGYYGINGGNSASSLTDLNVSLEALFNLGKSVFVKDCFVPTGHYLRMVLDSMFSNSKFSSNSVYESSLIHLTSGNGNILIDKNKVTAVDNLANWELIILQYIRICKVLLVSNFNSSADLIKLVSNFSRSFGSIDFVNGEDFPSFYDYNNALSATPSATTPTASITSPMSLDPFSNIGVNNNRGGVLPVQTQFSHQGIRVSFFEKDTGVSNALGSSATKSMLIDKPSIKLLNFWFNKSANLASINLWQLVGFGVLNFKNLFSILFELPMALKERQERKETKKNRKASTTSLNADQANKDQSSPSSGQQQQAQGQTQAQQQPTDNHSAPQLTTFNYDSLLKDPYPIASEMSAYKWFESLQFINKSSLELSFRMLKKFLNCPFKSVSTPHVIVWLYFLIALGKAIEKNPECESAVLGVIFKKFFPWDSLVNYLNFWVNEARECFDFDNLTKGFDIMEDHNDDDFVIEQNLIIQMRKLYSLGHEEYLDFFNNNETLIEVWKLWGSLWFNNIFEKKNYLNLKFAGWKGKDFLSDYIDKSEELLYIMKPDLNSQDNIQRSHNTNNNYFRDLFSEGDNCDRTNHRINLELHEKEERFERETLFKSGTFNRNPHSSEKSDRRLFNSVEKERIKRILLLAIYIAEKHPKFGLKLSDRFFKLDTSYVFNTSNSSRSTYRPTGGVSTGSGINVNNTDSDAGFNYNANDDSSSYMSTGHYQNSSNINEEKHKNTLVFEFVTDSRFSSLYEPINEVNIAKEGDGKFDFGLFFKSKENYDYYISHPPPPPTTRDDDDKSMINNDFGKVDVSMSFNNAEAHSDAEVDSSIMDDTESFLNYDIARKALGVDSHLDRDDEHHVDQSQLDAKEDHIISPDIQGDYGKYKVSPFDSVQQDSGGLSLTPELMLPHVPFAGNITSDIDTAITYITFDTNSWLKNCGKIYKIFKSCTLNKNVNLSLRISLPLLVYQELRSLRKSEDSFLSDSATRCVITIKNLYNDNVAFFQNNYDKNNTKTHETWLLLVKPDGSTTLNINDSCDMGEKNPTFKAIDDSILSSVAKSSKLIKKNYLAMLNEKYYGKVGEDSVLEFNGGKELNVQDLYNFKYNILITDNRPLRLKARSINVNAYQNKWLFYNLEKINIERACLD